MRSRDNGIRRIPEAGIAVVRGAVLLMARAREVGMKPLADFIVGKPAKKASRKSRKAVETSAEPAE